MSVYTKEDIAKIYDDLINSAFAYYAKGQFGDALNDIMTAANWAYHFNHIYTDPNVESLLRKISDDTIESVTIDKPKENHCVLLDSFLVDNRGLSQQYIRAIIAQGMRLLVILTKEGGCIGQDIRLEIEAYDKGKIVSYPQGIDQIDEASQIVREIKDFEPSLIFLHLSPWDVVALLACQAIKGVAKYQINLTDHAYWLGASFIDYCLEFRPYGMSVSLEKRYLKQGQLLALPFYPIRPLTRQFEGFPDLPSDAIKVFTGGALYKMLGKDNVFFRIMERILGINPHVYILVAGFEPDSRFDENVSKINGGERVKQIGVRHDIDAVFDHCDIYLGTYPMMGGLMCQYAALHGKPLVAYREKNDVMNATEEMVNFYQKEYRSFTDLNELTVYTERLITDLEFRNNQGALLKRGMMTVDRFNNEFLQIINTHCSSFVWEKDEINYDSFFERYLELEITNGFSATRDMVASQGLKVFLKLKRSKYKVLGVLFRSIIDRPPRRLFRRLFK